MKFSCHRFWLPVNRQWWHDSQAVLIITIFHHFGLRDINEIFSYFQLFWKSNYVKTMAGLFGNPNPQLKLRHFNFSIYSDFLINCKKSFLPHYIETLFFLSSVCICTQYIASHAGNRFFPPSSDAKLNQASSWHASLEALLRQFKLHARTVCWISSCRHDKKNPEWRI